VIDRLLLQRLQDLPEQFQRMAIALADGDAVARIARAVADVQIADVPQADDVRMLTTAFGGVKAAAPLRAPGTARSDAPPLARAAPKGRARSRGQSF
jgi:hypothetical protein